MSFLNTELMNVSTNGDIDQVKLLLLKDINIHVANDEPLVISSNEGHTKIVKLLLDNGGECSCTK